MTKIGKITQKIDQLGGVEYLTRQKKEGYKAKEVADMIGCDYSTLHQYLQRKGLKWKDLAGALDKITQAGGIPYLQQEKLKGRTQEEIALELGYTESSPIRRYLKKEGYEWKKLESGERKKHHEYIKPHPDKQFRRYPLTDNLKKQLLDYGGVDFLQRKFEKGYNIRELSEEFDWSYVYFAMVVREILDEVGVTKEELGYSNPRYRHYKIIEDKGGIPYLLESKMKGKTLDEISYDSCVSYEIIKNYLKHKEVEWKHLNSFDDVYYVPMLELWRGTFIIDGEVYDTALHTSIYDALREVRELKYKYADEQK